MHRHFFACALLSLGFLGGSLIGAGCVSGVPEELTDLPGLEGLETDPARLPGAMNPAAAERPTASASHIRVSYKGAEGANKYLKRTRAQARRRAEHLVALARMRGQDFSELARLYSDDGSTSMGGGDLGVIDRRTLHPELTEAIFALVPGVVLDPVESPHGFHVLLGQEPSELQTAEIHIAYDGAKPQAKYTLRSFRTPSEAEDLARQIQERALAGEDFAQLAIEYSDLYNHPRGGYYPLFKRGNQHPDFEKVAFSLKEGEVSPPFETVTGFHIVKRFAVERIRLRRIEILKERPQPEPPADPLPARTQDEARSLAEQVRSLALKGEKDFSWFAAQYDEGPGKNKLGAMDPFGRGEPGVPYEIEAAAFRMGPGEISLVIETKRSFAILKRLY